MDSIPGRSTKRIAGTVARSFPWRGTPRRKSTRFRRRPLPRQKKTASPRLGNNNAAFFALEFLGFRELAAQEFDVAARTWAAVGAQQAHAVEKNQQIENFGVFHTGEAGTLRLLLLCFGDKDGERRVDLPRKLRGGLFLVVDAAGQGLVGFREGLDGGKNVGIRRRRLSSAIFGDGKRERGHQLLMRVKDVGRE